MNDYSPIKNLESDSLKTFEVWKKSAFEFYPEIDFTCEKELVYRDVRNALNDSLDDLLRKGYHKNRLRNGWSLGVFLELLAKHLHYHWYNVFVLSHSDDYKTAMWLKAIITLLDQHPSFAMEVNRIYKLIVDQRYPFEKLNTLKLSKEELQQNKLIADLNFRENTDENNQRLNEWLKESISNTLDKRGPRHLTSENFYDFLDLEAYHQFIELNLYIND